MRTLLGALAAGSLVAFTAFPTPAQPAPTASTQEDRMAWWQEARFGLFIHWGLYAIPAGQWDKHDHHGEWIRETAQIPLETYDQFLPRFNPVEFDATAWVRAAKAAGMRYIVITSKHHDGFALFDSQVSDFDVMATPFKRDIMRELADAARAEGLKIGWYHSIMDWHHPDYLPRRHWELAQRPADGADFARFEAYLHAQVTELLTNYGPIDVMWFDGEWEDTWTEDHGRRLEALVRRLQPHTIINNRVGKARGGMGGLNVPGRAPLGDFATPEQEVPEHGLPGVHWESCITMNQHWGFNQADDNYKSPRELIRMLVDIASKGGNLLLNIGPTAEGTFPEPSLDRLQAIGRWMDVNSQSIYGTSMSPFGELPFGRCTAQVGESSTLYLHVFDWPEDGTFLLPGLATDATRAHLLADPSRTGTIRRRGPDVALRIDGNAPDPDCSVIAVQLTAPPIVNFPPDVEAVHDEFWNPIDVVLHNRVADSVLRYSLDGSPPTDASPIADGPITIQRTSTISAASFRDGARISPITVQILRRADLREAARVDARNIGLRCEEFAGEFSRLPDFDELKPDFVEVMPDFRLQGRQNKERTARRLTGYIVIPNDDVYTFMLASDDGSRLFIGDELVVDNDGLHVIQQRFGRIGLQAGLHPIRVEFFNRTGPGALYVGLAPLGGSFREITFDMLRH